MSFTHGFFRWHTYFLNSAKARVWHALLLGFLVYPVTVIGSEGEETGCLRFRDSAELYDRCLQEEYNDMHKPDSILVPKNPDVKPCYCDIRKQKQVELRLRKQEERSQGKSRFSSEHYFAAD